MFACIFWCLWRSKSDKVCFADLRNVFLAPSDALFDREGWQRRLAAERFPWNAPATQAAQSDQEEVGQESLGHDQEDRPGSVQREILEGIRHKVSETVKTLMSKANQGTARAETMCFFTENVVCSVKLGVIEDHSNRTRLAKLLRFFTSNHPTDQTSLEAYVERMKEKQDKIYFCAGNGREEVGGVNIRFCSFDRFQMC